MRILAEAIKEYLERHNIFYTEDEEYNTYWISLHNWRIEFGKYVDVIHVYDRSAGRYVASLKHPEGIEDPKFDFDHWAYGITYPMCPEIKPK